MLTNISICMGISFILIAAIGIIRMPDVLTRMSVVSKAITFGLGFILLGIIIHFNDTSTFIKVAIIYIFLSLSTSIAASVIGLAAYNDKKTKLSDLTFLDEMNDEKKQ
ncbi:MAG: monovalent cation/H(+) antiporter subunit G [Bacteroidetes bacterium]|nr:monovalent cation/H(+) antiporter subunit G [Bacteroidota bacterium]